MNIPTQADLDLIKSDAEDVVRHAVSLGVVLTIEQRPLTPLAMGHHLPIIEVRPARVRSA